MLSEKCAKLTACLRTLKKKLTLQRLILLLEVTNIHLLSGPFKRSA